jgi:hypothetical protein
MSELWQVGDGKAAAGAHVGTRWCSWTVYGMVWGLWRSVVCMCTVLTRPHLGVQNRNRRNAYVACRDDRPKCPKVFLCVS